MQKWLIGAAVFIASAAVLVLEIVAGRILAPYVGVSLQTFTGIIGTVLAAIAVGAWAGGRMADRRDSSTLLGPVLIVGGILAVVSPSFVYVLGPSASGEDPIAIVFLAAVGFFLPAAVLSAVTPIAAKMSLASLESTGSVVGQLSAIGTTGALFGTFVTGFFLIAAIPSQPITWVVGAVLVVFGVGLSAARGRVFAVLAVAMLGLVVVTSAGIAAPCDYETAYSCAIITGNPEQPAIRALILDTMVNSVVDTEDPAFLSSRYARVADAVIESHAPEGPLEILYIGGGGFALPRYYEATRGGSSTVLELDSVLPGIAVDELGLDAGPWLTVQTGDARLGIRNLDDGQFDVIVGDAFSGRSVPWHLTTEEFVEDVHAKLRTNGLYIMNVIDYPPNAFARAELASVASVFDYVAVVAPSAYLDGDRGGNFVLVGSDAPIDVDAINGLVTDGEIALVGDAVILWIGDGETLTDSFAPVDQLLTRP